MSDDVNNIMVILSSPSGAGKTTITKKIQQKYQSFKISVSHTTRKPRPNEIDGVDYYFVSQEKFKKLIDEKKFYEHAKIFDNYYGTLKKSVDDAFKKNDVQMSAKIKDLKNSADINWNDLENQDRVKDVKNLIKEMGRT